MTGTRPSAGGESGLYRMRAGEGASGAAECISGDAGGSDHPPLRRAGPFRRQLLFAGAGVALAGLLAAVLFVVGPRQRSATTGTGAVTVSQTNPPGINSATANLMSLSTLPGPTPTASNFHLTDQQGQPISLGQFRGKTVVLSFNDDRCVDMCPLLAQDIIRADHYLSAAQRRQVVFLAVNVNPFYPKVSDVKAFTDSHGLGKVANWHFVTGPVPTLEKIWKTYGETVQLHQKSRTVSHDSLLEFIAPNGHVAAAGQFGEGSADVSPFSHGLAQMAVDLLPPAERGKVGGHNATGSGTRGAGLGQQSPSFKLPVLGQSGASLSSSGLRGRPVVLNFWSSSCPDCRSELGAFAKLAKQEPNLRFVGIDVADPSTASALRLARQAGISYPVVADRSGALARSYHISELPTTIYLSPSGKVLVRHPGLLTYDELGYTLFLAFPNQAAHIGGD